MGEHTNKKAWRDISGSLEYELVEDEALMRVSIGYFKGSNSMGYVLISKDKGELEKHLFDISWKGFSKLMQSVHANGNIPIEARNSLTKLMVLSALPQEVHDIIHV